MTEVLFLDFSYPSSLSRYSRAVLLIDEFLERRGDIDCAFITFGFDKSFSIFNINETFFGMGFSLGFEVTELGEVTFSGKGNSRSWFNCGKSGVSGQLIVVF